MHVHVHKMLSVSIISSANIFPECTNGTSSSSYSPLTPSPVHHPSLSSLMSHTSALFQLSRSHNHKYLHRCIQSLSKITWLITNTFHCGVVENITHILTQLAIHKQTMHTERRYGMELAKSWHNCQTKNSSYTRDICLHFAYKTER